MKTIAEFDHILISVLIRMSCCLKSAAMPGMDENLKTEFEKMELLEKARSSPFRIQFYACKF